MDERPKIEVVRVSSFERRNFRPLDGVQLRAAYSHVRVGTYCTEIETDNETTAANMYENKPPVGGGQSRKFKKNLGPVSRMLRRRHQGTCLATKSCDNIYNVNTRNSNSLDWRMGQSATEPALQARQSSSLDWRVGRNVKNSGWRNASRSAEQLSRSPHFTAGGLHTQSAKSKIVSFLRRLSPRLSRNGSAKTRCGAGGPMSSSPTTCPWIRVEYSNESMNDTTAGREDSQESDVSYQRELQLNELRKKMLGCSPSSPSRSYSFASQPRIDNVPEDENANNGGSKIVENSNEEKSAIRNNRNCGAVHGDSRDTGKATETTTTTEKSRVTEAGRRRPRRGPAGRGEVAGLEGNDANGPFSNCTDNDDPQSHPVVVVVVGNSERPAATTTATSTTTNRRPRPISLAVQPLNYQRFDPDNFSASYNNNKYGDDEDEDEDHDGQALVVTRRCSTADKQHPNMTSQESIGNCSLDVDRSASDRSESTLGSVSERTLHSLNLSCNGQVQSPRDTEPSGSNETLQKQQQQRHEDGDQRKDESGGPILRIDCLNGEKSNAEGEQQLTSAKKPSYLGLACSISGYSGITRYDSKLREGFRSRDSSPGSRLITRETSPAGFRSSENLGVPGLNPPTKSQSISPLAMDRQNGFSNGGTKECKMESFAETRSTISSCQGFSEVDRGLQLHTNFADISPIRGGTSPAKRTHPTTMQISSFSRESKNYTSSISISSPRSGYTVSNNSFSETSFLNGSTTDAIENQTLNSSSCSEKSFIQQRVERLYGPGALAQGFFFKRSSATHPNTSDNGLGKSHSNNNDKSIDNANTEESLKNLPVLRHLRPEFRAQLPVVSSRKATDGTEQVIKPLQRISLTPPQRKNETSVKSSPGTNLSCNNARDNDSIKLSASVTSIPDQQPAAPEVVLPVLETGATSTSIVATEQTSQPVENPVEEKHGLHFMRLLNAERDRLLVLAESAEAELAKADPATLPEEAEGKLRSAAGKARLLAKQKMQQFEGLCHKNISQVPGEKFPTTYEDLAGFWDMVMLQVVQVNEIFAQIEKLKSSQWQEVSPEETRSRRNSRRDCRPEKKRNPVPRLSKLPYPHRRPTSPSVKLKNDVRETNDASKPPGEKIPNSGGEKLLEKLLPAREHLFGKLSKTKIAPWSVKKTRARGGCVEKTKLPSRQKVLNDPDFVRMIAQQIADARSRRTNSRTGESSLRKLGRECDKENIRNEATATTDKSTGMENSSFPVKNPSTRSGAAKFSRVIEVWSNVDEGSVNPDPRSSRSIASQCPVWKKSTPKDPRTRKILADVVDAARAEAKRSIVPDKLPAEDLQSKLERMRKYDSRRKRLEKRRNLAKNLTNDHTRETNDSIKNCDFNVYFVTPEVLRAENFAKISQRIFRPNDLGRRNDDDPRYVMAIDEKGATKNIRIEAIAKNIATPELARIYDRNYRRVKHFFTFVRFNRTFCRLSLYIYFYGMLSLVLIVLRLTTCKRFLFQETRVE